MEYTLTNKQRVNTMFFPYSGYIDIDIGGDNNLKVSMSTEDYDKDKFVSGGFIYLKGSELGGLLNVLGSDTGNKEVSYEGPTFRGMMMDRYCEPPTGQDYKIVSGELNAGISAICGSTFYGGLFRVASASTNVTLSNIQINRDISILEACDQFLKEANHKLKLSAVEYEEDDVVKFYIKVEAEPITDYSDEIEYSQDGLVNFTITKSPAVPYNYMLCLGKGELKDRARYHFKINSDGTLTEVSSIPDAIDTRVYLYENTNAADKDAMMTDATKKAKEINDTDSQKLSLSESMKVSLGDIVGGRDYITGEHVAEPITKVIYALKYGQESLSYTIGGQ